MAPNRIFISYRHEAPWASMADVFARKLRNYAGEWQLECYLDDRELRPGDSWRESVDGALARCTHMICLLCDTYWESGECRRELDAALRRRAAGEDVRPCFVMAEPMKPAYLRFHADGSPIGDVAKAGDLEFLGPKNDARQLVALADLPPAQWGGAVERMLDRLQRALHR